VAKKMISGAKESEIQENSYAALQVKIGDWEEYGVI
jgi:hypothetical protein